MVFYYLPNSPSSSCSPNWTRYNLSCSSDETQKVYYKDSNNCNNASAMPSNTTIGCDYDNNSLVGIPSNIQNIRVNITVKINDLNVNTSANANYTGIKEVKIFHDGNKIIDFNWNFSMPLDFKNIKIERQNSSSSFGYLIVDGLNISKEITIDRLNSASNRVCVKNSNISSISEVSAGCNSSNEYIINCPGTNSSFSCTNTSLTFTVLGLTKSAVIEFMGSARSCSVNWTCSIWSSCSSGSQTRTCTDSNLCGVQTGKLETTQACCTPSWQYTNWTPVKCPKNETQTRTAADINNCNVQTGKQSTTQSCTYEGGNLWFYLLIIGIIILIVAVIFIVFYFINKNKSSNFQPEYTPGSPIQTPRGPPPFAPPMNFQPRLD